MTAYLVYRRRRLPSFNRRRRGMVIKDLSPDLKARFRTMPDNADTLSRSWTFPTGKSVERNVQRLDRLVLGYFKRWGIDLPTIYPFQDALIEAISNATQHGRAKSRLSLELEVRRWTGNCLIRADVKNYLPPSRRVPLPEPRLPQFTKRGKGAWIMACQFVDRYTVEIKNGEFYRVVLTKLLPVCPSG